VLCEKVTRLELGTGKLPVLQEDRSLGFSPDTRWFAFFEEFDLD